MPVTTWESLKRILEEALESYNDINAIMNLVLFEDAMQHVYVKCMSAHWHCIHYDTLYQLFFVAVASTVYLSLLEVMLCSLEWVVAVNRA